MGAFHALLKSFFFFIACVTYVQLCSCSAHRLWTLDFNNPTYIRSITLESKTPFIIILDGVN